ncbi:helix-turn-helix transcriptional regulator [Nocardioides albus]|uniref:Uncharacterized protein n=1 Tax=Nocardioides albus TaxID=1841 RepID=A0A7W5F7Q3_9ACTN|nr:hypothetical protein [Nocardioides albus]MBB3088241.1 hypothetical protein [Nocardioides albus]GGU42837.1 hypothetical protein GCM10007979_47650 [Nocardioides albus]
MEPVAPTLTMQDVADLAHVSRPAVSMWRRRPNVRGRVIPFPEPVDVVAGIERFDRDEIVAWLAETGRGNNPDHAYDAPTLAAPLGVDPETVVTLLCLRALGVDELGPLTPAGVAAAAAQHDPKDALVRRELTGAEVDAATLRYVDDLVEGSYGLADALTRVGSGRLRREASEQGLADGLLRLLRTVVETARLHLGEDVALDPGGDAQVAAALGDGFIGLQVGEGEVARRLRRRALVAGVDVIEQATSCVRVVSMLGLADLEALEAVDEVTLELGPLDAAVVIGPSTLLCDRLSGDLDAQRAQTLRSGNLGFAARLPRGMRKDAARQGLGLWVLSGPVHTDRVRAADLTGADLDLADLASDLSGALAQTDDRAFRYALAVDLAPVRAGKASLVPRGAVAPRLGTSHQRDHLDRVHAATLTTSAPLTGFDVDVDRAPGSVVLRQRSLAELCDAGQLKRIRGARIDLDHADPGGTVPVLAADGSTDGVRLDPFDAERHYSHAVRTEPGDVVFSDKGTPAAVVDETGGAIVRSPSRILRPKAGAPVGPYALAAIINRQPGGEWETWTVPVLTADAADALDRTLAGIDGHIDELRRRLAAAHELQNALIDGVAAGTVALDTDHQSDSTQRTQRRAG